MTSRWGSDTSCPPLVVGSSLHGPWRALVLPVAILFLLGTAARDGVAQAGGSKRHGSRRTIIAPYDAPIIGVPVLLRVGQCGGMPSTGCADFVQEPTERFMDLQIFDEAGLPAYAEIYSSKNENLLASVCGGTDDPLAISRDMKIQVFVFATGPAALCAGTATTGTMQVIFSSRVRSP